MKPKEQQQEQPAKEQQQQPTIQLATTEQVLFAKLNEIAEGLMQLRQTLEKLQAEAEELDSDTEE